MLQKNSQEIRWFRVLEALSFAFAFLVFFGVCALLLIGMVFIFEIFLSHPADINWLLLGLPLY